MLQYKRNQSFHQILVNYISSNWYIFWVKLETIIPWAWRIMIIWKMYLYMTCWDKIMIRLGTSWWNFLIIVGKIVQKISESTWAYIIFYQGGPINYGTHVPGYNNSKDTKYTRYISRKVYYVRKFEKWKFRKIAWCKEGLKLSYIWTKNVG